MPKNAELLPLQALNPFAPGAGRRPPELVGRESELELMDTILARTKLGLSNQGIIYSGLRGVGKTVLLLEFYDMAIKQNITAVRLETSGNAERDYDALFRETSKAILRIRDGRLRKTLADAFSHVESVSLEFLGFKTSLQMQNDAASDRQIQSSSYRLELLIEELSEALRQANSGLILFIDEFQEMAADLMGTLLTLQHEMGQRNLPFIIIGAGLPNLPGVLTKVRSYAERLFDYRVIGRISDREAAQGFQKSVEQVGRRFTSDALERLVSLCQGYPYFIQAYGEAAWNASDSSPIPLKAVNRGEPTARAALDRGLYLSRWQRATSSGREYLSAMAALGEDSCNSSQVAKHLGKTMQELSTARQTLIHHGLIYVPERGKVAFTVPDMAAFIQRASPVDEVNYE